MVLYLRMKFFVVILILACAAGGCITKSKARVEIRAAYLEGLQAGQQNSGAQTNIVVLGDVERHQVPWVEGLTLAQAIATATYSGLHDPKEIILKRQGEDARVNPKDLLHGHDVPLEPGDVVTVNER